MERRGLDLSRDDFYSECFNGYAFEGFPEAMNDIAVGTPAVRFNCTIGKLWVISEIVAENQDFGHLE
jgi:hypothetical protein